MASPAGRGAQVRLDGDAQAAARGATGQTLIATQEAKRALEYAGLVADGSTQDGSSRTGLAPDDELLVPAGTDVSTLIATAQSALNTGLGIIPYSATFAGGVITEVANGVTVTSTLGAGTITAVYGAPVNQTWRTTISDGSVSTVRIA
jgi:hypothetical protein